MVREVDGWRDIAATLGKALGCSVSIRTAQRYAAPDWPTAENPHPLVLGQRGNGTRFLRVDEVFLGWVAWYKGKPGVRRVLAGDRRRLGCVA